MSAQNLEMKMILTGMYHISHVPYEAYIMLKHNNFDMESFIDEFNQWLIADFTGPLKEDSESNIYRNRKIEKQLKGGFKQLDKELYNTRAKSMGETLKQLKTYKYDSDIDMNMKENTTPWVDMPLGLFRISHTTMESYQVLAFSFNPVLRFEDITLTINKFTAYYAKKYNIDAEFIARLYGYDFPDYINDRFDSIVLADKRIKNDLQYFRLDTEGRIVINPSKYNNLLGYLLTTADTCNKAYIAKTVKHTKTGEMTGFMPQFEKSLANDKRLLTVQLTNAIKPKTGIVYRQSYITGVALGMKSQKYIMTEATENALQLEGVNIIDNIDVLLELRANIFKITNADLIDGYYKNVEYYLTMLDYLTDNNVPETALTDSMRALMNFDDEKEQNEFIADLESKLLLAESNINAQEKSDISGTNMYFELCSI